MLTLTGSAAYVALVSTAGSLPVVLFAVAAGAIGDLVDRRRFLLVSQGFMLAAAVALDDDEQRDEHHQGGAVCP